MNLLAAYGNVCSVLLLAAADLISTCIRLPVLAAVYVLDKCTGSGANTARAKLPWHAQRYATSPILVSGAGAAYGELDVPSTLAASQFPIKPDKLVALAKAVLAAEFGTAKGADPHALLADDFQFVAPIVGPLGKHEFLQAFGSFKVKDAFPDLQDNSWFQVDPLEPNRVWFVSRATGTHTGTLNFARPIAPTGKQVLSPPQAQSMLFDEAGKVYTLTVGYCMDKRIGNTEGLGGVFALLKGIGHPLPFPEAQRLYSPSLRFEAFERIAKAAESLGFSPTAPKKGLEEQLM